MAIEDPELANTHSNTPHDFTSVQDPKPEIPMMFRRLLQEYPPGFYRKFGFVHGSGGLVVRCCTHKVPNFKAITPSMTLLNIPLLMGISPTTPAFLMMIAETIATFMLVFVGSGCGGLSESDDRRVSKLGASIGGGLVVTVMIYAVGHISGAHMNPAVTLAFAAVRHFPWKQVPLYAAAQLTGAISAAFTARILTEPIKHVGTTSPSGSDMQALIMEIVLTFSLMFITSAVATDTKAVGELAGIAVGSAVCIASILGGPISGGSMNPARSIGPALASSYYKGLWVYILGPVIGALTGAWAYNFIRLTDKTGREISPSFSFKLRRMKSHQEQPTDNTANPLDS